MPWCDRFHFYCDEIACGVSVCDIASNSGGHARDPSAPDVDPQNPRKRAEPRLGYMRGIA
jgi:hypothetical protein